MWVKRFNDTVWHPATRPGIWRRKAGGYLVTVDTRRNGVRKTAQRTLPTASLADAIEELGDLRTTLRRGGKAGLSKLLFATYAVSLLQRKIAAREIRSAKGIERWITTLEKHLVPAFGEIRCVDLGFPAISAWRDSIAARLHKPGRKKPDPNGLSPRTANGWFSILRVICKAMVRDLELERDPSLPLANFPTIDHPTYTAESPNSLRPDDFPLFMEKMRELFPQFYAMTAMGFATGLRPSTLRPIRRSGPDADIDFPSGKLILRRSNSLGQSASHGTKTAEGQVIWLPVGLIEILREHVAFIQSSEKQRESELLFPSTRGGFRSRSCLDKPFRVVAKEIGLKYRVSPKAMRRTFNDLARHAGIEHVVTRSISGHQTDRMQVHYSTAAPSEQIAAVGKVVSLFRGAK